MRRSLLDSTHGMQARASRGTMFSSFPVGELVHICSSILQMFPVKCACMHASSNMPCQRPFKAFTNAVQRAYPISGHRVSRPRAALNGQNGGLGDDNSKLPEELQGVYFF